MEYCWIAERGGINIGSVLVTNGGDGVAKLRLLYVDKAARGLGLGKMLVDECIRFARQRNIDRSRSGPTTSCTPRAAST